MFYQSKVESFISCLRVAALSAPIVFASCNRYADFTLPQLPAAPPLELHFIPSPTPVLSGTGDLLNPSVALHDHRYFNFYSQFDGRTWHTHLAESTDGQKWTSSARILSPDPQSWEGSYIAANGSAFNENGQWLYWYQSGPREHPSIGVASSRDPHNLHKHAQPVLSPGPRGSFDEEAVADPYVIRLSSWFYMYYMGMDRARRQQIGLARSPDGFVWEKLRSSPVVHVSSLGGMDENGLGEPAVWQSNGWYWMLFTGRDSHEYRTLGLARSSDGVNWLRSAQVFRGAEPWNEKVLCDPTVLVEGQNIKVWFGGGDIASPDENLHGQIGYGQMKE